MLWKQQAEVRTKVIEDRKAEWEKEKIQWEAECVAARAAEDKFSRKQPTRGKLPPVIPRPPVVPVKLDDEDDDEDE